METNNNMEGAKVMPVQDGKKVALPPHSDPKEGYMGPDGGTMGEFYKNIAQGE